MAETKQTGIVSYTAGGETINLTKEMVAKQLVKGNTAATDKEIINFMCLCKYNHLNPFLNEAYLVKFGGDAQMITSKEAYFKRAEAEPAYDGIEAGVIVQTEKGEIKEYEGCFYAGKEILVGGWAKVYRKDRKVPVTAKVRLDEFDKGNSIWKEKKGTMIAKIAKVQALREAFPSKLGALYTQEEAVGLNLVNEETGEVNEQKPTNDATEQVLQKAKRATAKAEKVAQVVEEAEIVEDTITEPNNE